MNPLEVTFRLNGDDVHAAQWHYVSTSPAMRRNYRFAGVVVLVLTSILPLFLMLVEALDPVTGGALVAGFFVVWVFQFPRSYRQGIERSTRKLLKEGRNALLQCTFRMEIDEAGLNVKTDLGESRLAWGAVERVEETESHIFIRIGSMTGHVVPKWAFESRRHAEEFFAAAAEFQRRAEFS